IFLWPICEALSGMRIPVRVVALGLPLGILWEAVNWRCARGWVYTVPFFDHPKVFEMPLPGYLGYLPFAMECAAALALLDLLRRPEPALCSGSVLGAMGRARMGNRIRAAPVGLLPRDARHDGATQVDGDPGDVEAGPGRRVEDPRRLPA